MDLKSIEGNAALTDDAVVLTFDRMVSLTEKKAVSPRVIPFKHVREVDFVAPTIWKPGYLRIIMRADQERVNSLIPPTRPAADRRPLGSLSCS